MPKFDREIPEERLRFRKRRTTATIFEELETNLKQQHLQFLLILSQQEQPVPFLPTINITIWVCWL